jgi:hypothetical protein
MTHSNLRVEVQGPFLSGQSSGGKKRRGWLRTSADQTIQKR